MKNGVLCMVRVDTIPNMFFYHHFESLVLLRNLLDKDHLAIHHMPIIEYSTFHKKYSGLLKVRILPKDFWLYL
jgi:hypothetical protein